MRWLADILKDGTLKDNQFYQAKDNILSNRMFKSDIALDDHKHRQTYTPNNDLNGVWNFLNSQILELNNILQSPSTKKELILINRSEYEHNSEDPFAKINGLNARNFSLQTGNIIGFVKKGSYALNIGSRFGNNFLKYIISDTDGFLEIEDFGGKESKQNYEWLILYLWKIKLKKAFRLGLPKAYITKKESSNKVRGMIDVQDYFLNSNNGKYKCTYREHSFNIEANRLISAVFKKHQQNGLISDLHMIENAFETAVEGSRSTKDSLLKTSYFHNPFYSSYNEIIDLSKLILRDELADFGESSNLNAYLFDVSMLFEYFVRKLLMNHGFELYDKFSERLTIPAGSIENYRRKLEPDIVFEIHGKTYVFDVKYKSYDFRYGAKREDIFQLHSYLGQYTNQKASVGACGFIYPISENRWNEKLKDKNGMITEELIFAGKSIKFCVCFIKIPQDNTIEVKSFKERFNESCDLFLEQFKNTITNG